MTDKAPAHHVRFPWILTVVTALALILLLSLGVWQVQRLQWKQGLMAEARREQERPPVLLSAIREPLTPYQKVIVDCDFGDRVHRLIELQTIHDGTPGVRLISNCRDHLVDLGFIAEGTTDRPVQGLYAESQASIRAEVRQTEPLNAFTPPYEGGILFYGRDTKKMSTVLGMPVRPPEVTLYATTSAFVSFSPLKPSVPPVAFSNNHLGYALTWFGMAIALIGFYVAMLRRARNSQAAGPRGSGDREKEAS